MENWTRGLISNSRRNSSFPAKKHQSVVCIRASMASNRNPEYGMPPSTLFLENLDYVQAMPIYACTYAITKESLCPWLSGWRKAVASNNKSLIEEIIRYLRKSFDMCQGPANHFFGLSISMDRNDTTPYVEIYTWMCHSQTTSTRF